MSPSSFYKPVLDGMTLSPGDWSGDPFAEVDAACAARESERRREAERDGYFRGPSYSDGAPSSIPPLVDREVMHWRRMYYSAAADLREAKREMFALEEDLQWPPPDEGGRDREHEARLADRLRWEQEVGGEVSRKTLDALLHGDGSSPGLGGDAGPGALE